MLQEIISFCPLVELDISYNNHLNKISLPLIRKVNREVEVRGSGTMQSDLQASQLQKFVYHSCYADSPWPWNMNVIALKNLRKLEISWACITGDIVSELASGLIALESLVLETCSMLKFIKISSNSLRELQILNYLNINELKNVTVDAPNLRELLYKCKVETPLSFIRVLDHCNAQFFPIVTVSVTNVWFVKLKKLLTETDLFKSLVLNLGCSRLVRYCSRGGATEECGYWSTVQTQRVKAAGNKTLGLYKIFTCRFSGWSLLVLPPLCAVNNNKSKEFGCAVDREHPQGKSAMLEGSLEKH